MRKERFNFDGGDKDIENTDANIFKGVSRGDHRSKMTDVHSNDSNNLIFMEDDDDLGQDSKSELVSI